MTPETFREQFETFAEAPNGIAKLRELILQLAVQGKLGTQDANDEPASQALERAKRNHDSQSKSNAGLRSCAVSVNAIEENAYLPKGWIAVELDDVCSQVTDGEHLTPQREANGEIPLVTAKNVRDGFIDLAVTDFISRDTAEKCWKRCCPIDSDILMVCVGATTGRLTVLTDPPPIVIVRSVALFRPMLDLLAPDYLAIVLRSPVGQSQIWGSVKQSAQPCLYISKSKRMPLPLPPLAEQRRIVLKVDQLLGLCDELAACQAARREARSALVGATLDRLVSRANNQNTSSPSPRFGERGSGGEGQHRTQRRPPHPQPFSPVSGGEGSKDMDVNRLRDHFDRLFDTPTTIPQLRQAILQLAVQGQLVPQDPNDEPADELLARVDSEKRRLEDLGELKTQPPMSPLADWEVLFPIPSTWKWVRAAELSYPISSGSTPAKSVFQSSPEGGVPYLKVYNIRGQKIDFEHCPQYINQMYHASKMKRSILLPGMVVLNIVGPPLGKTAVIPATFPEWNCNQAIAFFRFIGDVQPEYVHTYFKAGSFLKNIALIGTAGQDNISVTKCKNIVIPLPPLSEQKRIVSKVTELMSLCDALEAKLTQAESASTQLLSAAVHHLITGANANA
jgi:type I restriction enzyme S subunit